MKTAVYYFSGTGNSLVLARALASRLGAGCASMACAAGSGLAGADADRIGLVFPVYYGELPLIVRDFAGKLPAAGKYVFAVCTYGGGKSHSMRILSSVLKERGGELAAGFGVHMPQNAFKKPWEDPEKLTARALAKMETVANAVKAGLRGQFLGNKALDALLIPLHLLFKPLYVRGFVKKTGLPEDTPFDEFILQADRSFRVNAACTGCGQCARVCPVGNVALKDGRPEWLHRCQNCLACYDWCPSGAIEGGVAQEGYHYRNPRVKAGDFIRQ